MVPLSLLVKYRIKQTGSRQVFRMSSLMSGGLSNQLELDFNKEIERGLTCLTPGISVFCAQIGNYTVNSLGSGVLDY